MEEVASKMARRTVKEEVSQILQRVSSDAARRILLPLRGQYWAVTVAAKSRQFTADETGKCQFLRGNRRNLAEDGVVRKISSPRRVASVPNLCNDRGQPARDMDKWKCYSGFAERVR